MYFPCSLNFLSTSNLHLVHQFVPGLQSEKDSPTDLVKGQVQVVWDWYFGQFSAMPPWRWTRTSFVVSMHLVPVLQTNPGSRWNPPVLAKIFPARLREAESLQLSFSSPFPFVYAPFVVHFRRHASYNKSSSARSMTRVFKTWKHFW